MVDDPNDGRGFFRFRRSALDRIVGDRELMLRQAEQRAREAEERAKRLEEQVERGAGNGSPTNGAAAGKVPHLGDAVARRASSSPGLAALPPDQLEALVGAIVSAAEEVAGKLSEDANGARTDFDPEHIRREMDAAARGLDRSSDPAVREARDKLERVRRQVEELPDRLVDALKPLADAVREADAGLRDLDRPE